MQRTQLQQQQQQQLAIRKSAAATAKNKLPPLLPKFHMLSAA